MKLHANAALSWSGRRLLVERVLVDHWTLTAAAEAAGVSVRCARKWIGRYRVEGERGLRDRSSAPRRISNRTPADRIAVIVLLRQLRMTAAEIAETLQMPLSTVSVVLKRQGMGRLGRIGLEQPVRYERSRPCELVHIDVKSSAGSRAERASVSVAGRTRITTAATPTRQAVAVIPSAGSTSTSPSTTSADSPTSRSSPTRKAPPPSASSAGRSPSLPATGSASSASSPTTGRPTAPSSMPSPARSSASVTSELAHTARRPTAKPSGSSARSSPAGLTARSTNQATNEPQPLTAGSGTTTIDDDTQPSATTPRSAEPTCLGPTTRPRAR